MVLLSSAADKERLRSWGRERRRSLSARQRSESSRRVVRLFAEWLAARQSLSHPVQLLLYRSMREEVDSAALFTPPCVTELFAPVVRGDTMLWSHVDEGTVWSCGSFGLLEPQSVRQWQPSPSLATIVVCPLTVFDRCGGRVGMGKGYFDRWLADHCTDLLAVVGFAFSCQECDRVVMEPHDQRLQWVITEKECIVCR
ncbi:MAG: 5-formyltetrahydrofolate cyclo-ligase [Mariprofundales bacterium]|nr:5-formyltetrahydrofolate cyclo-ligase [Mariprofundales bacterium]